MKMSNKNEYCLVHIGGHSGVLKCRSAGLGTHCVAVLQRIAKSCPLESLSPQIESFSKGVSL